MGHHMDSLRHGRQSNRRMGMVRCHDFDGIDPFFFGKHFPEIFILGTAFVFFGGFVLSIILLHISLSDIPASRDSGDIVPPRVISQDFADVIADAIGGPIDIVSAEFVGITDCHYPDSWILEQISHFAQALGPAANVGHGNLIRGRNFAASGDDMGWDDGDGRCDGSCRTDKFSSVDFIRLVHWAYVIAGQ